MRRRDFIGIVGGAAAAWPFAARSQIADQARRIGVLYPGRADDAVALTRIRAFVSGLQELNWADGRNMRIEYRWAAGDAGRIRKYAAELVALGPDVILANGNSCVGPLQQATSIIPIVFVNVIDPVSAGFVANAARPGGNITGFTTSEYSESGKMLELLKQLAPQTTKVAVLRDPSVASGSGQLGALQAVAPFLRVQISPIDVRDPGEIKRGLAELARGSNGGMILVAGAMGIVHRALIIELVAHHSLPAVYPYRFLVTDGGLASYGPETTEPYHRAAGYVDRILRGEKPADLPVQAPTKYHLAINLKTARTLGLDVSPTLLARADEVIE